MRISSSLGPAHELGEGPREAALTPDLVAHLYLGAGVADAAGTTATPGALLVALTRPEPIGVSGPVTAVWSERATVLAAGRRDEVVSHPAAAGARVFELAGCVLLPGLVNAHAHLDLTHIGPRAYDRERGFVGFVSTISRERRLDAEGIRESVRRGVELSIAGGVVAVGDIAGMAGGVPRFEPYDELSGSVLKGVSYIEFFSFGTRERVGVEATIEALAGLLDQGLREGAIRIGVEPHAPYSVALSAYRRIAAFAERHGLPICTHLAENTEERAFIAEASGPFRGLVEQLGLWPDPPPAELGLGRSPVRHLADVLRLAPFRAVHLNDLDDRDIEALRGAGSVAVYCPRASAYFGHSEAFGPHRYRDLLRAGVPVALGTDSVISLPPEAADPAKGGISTLDEMRLLYRRDGAAARDLLAMGTTAGAVALHLDPTHFTFISGADCAGAVAVETGTLRAGEDPIEAVMRTSGLPRLLFC